MKILVAGEQRELGASLLPFLARKGHTLLFVQTAEEFIERVRTEPFDLIILDLELSTEDSFGTSERLRSEFQAISIPMIAVAESTRLMPCLKELGRLLKENTVAVLDKPVDPEELEKEIARILDEKTLKTACLPGETLTRLVDGELSEQEAERAQRHLSQCQSCQRRYEETRGTDSALRQSFSKAMRIKIESSEECISPRELTAYFRDGLPSQKRTAIEEHLSQCSYCTRELVSLYRLMKEFGEKETEPLGEAILQRLRVGMRELLDKAKGPLICIHCFGSIPLESESCPRCGAWVRGKAQEKEGEGNADKGSREDRDRGAGGTPSDQGYLGTRRVQVAGSLFALVLAASVVLLGITTYQNYRFNVIARPAINKVNTLFSAGGENILAEHIRKSVDEEIEVFGRVAMYESKARLSEVPADVERIARMVVEQYYYDEAVAEKAFRQEDVRKAFQALNRSENRGLRSRFLPKYPNRILSPDEMQFLKDEMAGNFTGIGIFGKRARWGTGGEITGFPPNSPAKEAGLRVGDIITEVDRKSLRGADTREIVAAVRGPAGTRARLKVRRRGVLDFEKWVLRKQTSVAHVEFTLVGADAGHVRIHWLAEGVSEQIKDALNEPKNSHVRKLLLDLRGNTGGSLQIAADTAALFLPEGTPITRAAIGKGERCYYAEQPPVWDGPLAVLVDDETMSGGELIAAALKGTGRAVIVGERTAGKGSVQTIYRLDSGYGIQLTTDVLAGPNGMIFNNEGVTADVEVVGGKRAGLPDQPGQFVAADRVVRIAVEQLEDVAFSTSGEGRIRDEERTDQGGEGTQEHFVSGL
jgi:C-terminal peptidase prc